MILTLEEIIVGDRVRRDLGDLSSLCASMTEVGLINPITVDGQEDGSYRLIAGARRLEAARRLGWLEIDAHVVECLADAVLALKAERDENTCRVDFTPSEAVEVGLRLEELEERGAEDRRAAGRVAGGHARHGSTVANCPQADRAKVRDIVAPAVGMSPRTYAKAREVVKAAADEALPAEVREVAQAAVEQMDTTGKVEPAHRAVVEAKRKASPPSPEEQERLAAYSRVELLIKATSGYGAVATAEQREYTARLLFDAAAFHSHPAHQHVDHDRVLRELREMGRGLVTLFDEYSKEQN